MKRITILLMIFFIGSLTLSAQIKWQNVDSLFAPLPANFHVYKTVENMGGKPFIAYYAEAKLKDKNLIFTDDTAHDRRITPIKFYERNNKPLLVANCTFFSYETNRSLNVVIKNGKMVAFNNHTIPMKGKDTLQYQHPLGSAIGIDKKRNADVAWMFTDSAKKYPYAIQSVVTPVKDSTIYFTLQQAKKNNLHKWKMQTAVGGTPVLVQDGKIKVTNEEEVRFTGKAINDKHPRTCMGYTADGRLIVMVIQGRLPGVAEGATLTQQAQLLIDLGCIEALNLDGGGSSCMLINGKETIKPSDKEGQRPVPAVFIINKN